MPLYEYRCPTCDHRFEVLQRMGAGADEVLCPHCGGERPQKQLSTFATASGGSSDRLEAAPSCGATSCCGGGWCEN